MARKIDLNADLGELEGENARRLDREIMSSITSCNIACGGHAGDKALMEASIRAATDAGILIGAHPSYPDRENFGRVSLQMSDDNLMASLYEQVQSLIDIAHEQSARVTHIKAHGALYNACVRSEKLSDLLCDLADQCNIGTVFGLPKSALETACARRGIRYIAEGFSDRSYEADGQLTPRSLDGAVHADNQTVLNQAKSLAQGHSFIARTGENISPDVDTLCLHGDTPGAALLSKNIHDVLVADGVDVVGYQ